VITFPGAKAAARTAAYCSTPLLDRFSPATVQGELEVAAVMSARFAAALLDFAQGPATRIA
jgi:hypothetical protein